MPLRRRFEQELDVTAQDHCILYKVRCVRARRFLRQIFVQGSASSEAQRFCAKSTQTEISLLAGSSLTSPAWDACRNCSGRRSRWWARLTIRSVPVSALRSLCETFHTWNTLVSLAVKGAVVKKRWMVLPRPPA